MPGRKKSKVRLMWARIPIALNESFEAAKKARGHTHTEAIEGAITLYVLESHFEELVGKAEAVAGKSHGAQSR